MLLLYSLGLPFLVLPSRLPPGLPTLAFCHPRWQWGYSEASPQCLSLSWQAHAGRPRPHHSLPTHKGSLWPEDWPLPGECNAFAEMHFFTGSRLSLTNEQTAQSLSFAIRVSLEAWNAGSFGMLPGLGTCQRVAHMCAHLLLEMNELDLVRLGGEGCRL